MGFLYPSRRSKYYRDDIYHRFCYICEYFFGGDIASFARILGITHVRAQRFFRRPTAISLRLVARTVARFDIRAEWLLCGSGQMLKPGVTAQFFEPPESHVIVLPRKLVSPYPMFAAGTPVRLKTKRRKLVQVIATKPTAASDYLAKQLFTASGANCSIVVFSDTVRERHCRKLLIRLLRQKCVSCLVFTGAAAEAEISTQPGVGLADFARLGAAAGFGLGAAVQRWAVLTRRSPISLARARGIPFAVQCSFGELADHFSATVSGAEPGAVLGACAYIDSLVFAENVRQLAASGGLFLVLGATERALETFITAYRRVAETVVPRKFSVVVLGARAWDRPCKEIRALGGDVHFLDGALEQVAEELRLSCIEVFDGNLHDDDDENDRTDN